MSSSKSKHVRYDVGTKGEKKSHTHRSSRDSGLGSSSASDRASLGEPHNDSHFSRAEIESQRQILRVVQEALDAATARAKALEAQNVQLNHQLKESHKENRLLRLEKTELHNKVEDLKDDLEDERKTNEKLRRASPPRSPTSDRSARRTEGQRTQAVAERRNSHYERPPTAPSTPASHPNPFTPLSSRPPVLTYATPVQSPYPTSASYTAAPVFAVSQPTHRSQQPPNDGRYHLTPL